MNEHKKNILILDDYKNWRETFADVLGNEDYTFLYAETHEEALGLFKKHHFHVAVIDICLNDNEVTNVQGVELVYQELKEYNTLTQFVVVTGYDQHDATVKHAVEYLNVFAYIRKEDKFDPKNFRVTVREAVEKAEKNRSKDHILVIEANEKIRGSIQTIMQDEGYAVHTCSTPQEHHPKPTKNNFVFINTNFLYQDFSLLQRLKTTKSAPRMILLAEPKLDSIIQAVRCGNINDSLMVTEQQSPHELRKSVQQIISNHAIKYLVLYGDPEQKFYVNNSCTLTLRLQDKPEAGTESIWIPSEKEINFLVDCTLSNGTVHPEQFFWNIPADQLPIPQSLQFIPKSPGMQTIKIRIQDRQFTLATLEKQLDVQYLQDDNFHKEKHVDARLSHDDRQRLVDELMRLPAWKSGIEGERSVILAAGLPDAINNQIVLKGSPETDAQLLIEAIENFGHLPERPTHTAIGALAEYLLKNASVGGKNFLSDLIRRRHHLIHNESPYQSQEASMGNIQPDTTKKILFVSAEPTDKARIQTDKEYRVIKAEMERGRHRDCFEFLQPQFAVTITELLRAMNDKPNIVHFAGHGGTEGICISTDDNKTQLVPVSALKRLFTPLKGIIEVVLLNSCYSAEQAAIISEYGIFVICMKSEIKDEAAVSFAKGMYNGLGEGKAIEAAYNDAMFVFEAENPCHDNVIESWKNGEKLDL